MCSCVVAGPRSERPFPRGRQERLGDPSLAFSPMFVFHHRFLEGCGPSQPLVAVNQHHFAAPTERTPSRESASNGHPVVATMIGDLEGCGPSQPLVAVNQHHFTAPTERTPSREAASNGHPVVATAIGGGLEGCGPSQPRCAEINTVTRRRRSGRPPGKWPAMAIRSWQR